MRQRGWRGRKTVAYTQIQMHTVKREGMCKFLHKIVKVEEAQTL